MTFFGQANKIEWIETRVDARTQLLNAKQCLSTNRQHTQMTADHPFYLKEQLERILEKKRC